ncbi:VIT family protein [Halobacteriovorax sp. JY17]|uniref:VIT1/CCC1 transporter family protein n=1 Tax=Halobacteriovorax sp. JY17 TaxID=2014617 RepID=UPI000C49A7B4|nr:VIT family protein [Halobacteriovorax sp. JY17]PIK16422.1 MAG: hypothetical protein CES88_06690 [Halobacteriovorax sp. JY17]
MRHNQRELHKITNVGFLRAAVLGANDGIISTSSLIVGVTSSGLSEKEILTTSIAALIAGAMSMAAGEFVSVSSQADTEKADIKKEKWELENEPEAELIELKNIYLKRGLSEKLALEVAHELTNHNALDAHLRDELGIVNEHKAKPLQAALVSAFTFIAGAILPILVILIVDIENLVFSEVFVTILALLVMGGVAAKSGGAKLWIGSIRVAFWGAAAMGFTALIGYLFMIS